MQTVCSEAAGHMPSGSLAQTGQCELMRSPPLFLLIRRSPGFGVPREEAYIDDARFWKYKFADLGVAEVLKGGCFTSP